MHRHVNLSFFVLLGVLLSAFAVAETTPSSAADVQTPAEAEAIEIEPVYQVEFIIIRPRSRDDINSEDWLDERPRLESDDLTQTDTATEQPLEALELFSWTKEEQWDLPHTMRRLKQNGNYDLLMHRSWRQQATPRDNPVAFIAQLPFDEANQATPILDLEDQPVAAEAGFNAKPENAFNSGDGFTIGLLSEPMLKAETKAGVFGTISFSKARYLHFSVDLVMSEHQDQPSQDDWQSNWQSNAAKDNTGGYGLGEQSSGISSANQLSESLGLAVISKPSFRHYHLVETRRIKTEETHYFDHPAFAVLAHVRRLTPEELEAYVAEAANTAEADEKPAEASF